MPYTVYTHICQKGRLNFYTTLSVSSTGGSNISQIRDGISLGMAFVRRIIDSILVVVLRDVARYRFKVIRSNLISAFDYTSREEIRIDIYRNYRFMTKIIRQVLIKPTKARLHRHLRFTAHPAVDQWLRENKSVIVCMGHVGNWEWAGLYLGLMYPGRVCALYKEIKSGYVNRLMLKRRAATVDHLVEIGQLGDLIRLIREKSVLILMIADQNPGNDQGIQWVSFFNRETAFVPGPEILASKYHLPVVYLRNESDEQERYHLSFEIIHDGEGEVEKGFIIKQYAAMLENNIRTKKTEWLWSHKRWKRVRE